MSSLYSVAKRRCLEATPTLVGRRSAPSDCLPCPKRFQPAKQERLLSGSATRFAKGRIWGLAGQLLFAAEPQLRLEAVVHATVAE